MYVPIRYDLSSAIASLRASSGPLEVFDSQSWMPAFQSIANESKSGFARWLSEAEGNEGLSG